MIFIATSLIKVTLFAVIAACAEAITSIFTYLLAKFNSKNDKNTKKQEKIEKATTDLENVCDNGTIDELIDATIKIKESNK